MSRNWKGGSTRRWREQRRRILLRDRGLCQIQLPGVCRIQADCVDHIKGKGVSEADEDLQAACTPCNLRKGQPGRGRVEHKRISKW